MGEHMKRADYISRDAALEVVERYFTKLLELNPDICLDGIKTIPAADVVEVVHARPVKFYCDARTGRMMTTCSVCDMKIGPYDSFCKHCGAKMDGGQDDV